MPRILDEMPDPGSGQTSNTRSRLKAVPEELREFMRKHDIRTVGHLRTLKALAGLTNPVSTLCLSEMTGNSRPTMLGRYIGPIDPAARKQAERSKHGWGTPDNPYPSFLTRGWVDHITLDIDGIAEETFVLTPAGREVVDEVLMTETDEQTGDQIEKRLIDFELPPVANS